MSPEPETLPPIACTLTGQDFGGRLAQIAALNSDALRSHTRDGLRLTLTYDLAVSDRVRALMAQEQECCAFLVFHLAEAGDAVVLTITAPDAAREMAEAVFAPFLPTPESRCGCCAGGAE